MSAGRASPHWCRRNASLRRRRARLRCTAPPTFRLVITPSLAGCPRFAGVQFKMRQPTGSRCPSALSRAKSRAALSRRPDRRWRGVAGISNSRLSHWSQTLPPEIPAAADDLTAALGGHAGAEAMLADPANLRRLILTFHAVFNAVPTRETERRTVTIANLASIAASRGLIPPVRKRVPARGRCPVRRGVPGRSDSAAGAGGRRP